MRFEFQKSRNYKEQYCVNEHDVLRYFETRYISRGFLPLLSAAMKDKKLIVETGSDKIKGRSAGNEDEDGTNINDENDRKMEQIDRTYLCFKIEKKMAHQVKPFDNLAVIVKRGIVESL